jgi:DNA-binding Lrp family transcriptional regulator
MSEMNQPYEDTFFIVPRYIRKLPGMTLGFLDVYETIFQFLNKGKDCYLSNPAIAERTGLGERHIKKALVYLEEREVIKRVTIKGKRYIVSASRTLDQNETAKEGGPAVPRGGSSSSLEGGHLGHPEYKEVNIKNLKDIVDLPSAKTTRRIIKDYKKDEQFMRFYSAYPKHQKPQDAFKAFNSVVKGDEPTLLLILVDIAERSNRHTQWQDSQYIEHPATYLRAKTWEGDIINTEVEATKKKEKSSEAGRQQVEELERQSRVRGQNDTLIYQAIQKEVKQGNKSKPSTGFKDMIRRLQG